METPALSNVTAATAIALITRQIEEMEKVQQKIQAYDRLPRWGKYMKGGAAYRRRLVKKLVKMDWDFNSNDFIFSGFKE